MSLKLILELELSDIHLKLLDSPCYLMSMSQRRCRVLMNAVIQLLDILSHHIFELRDDSMDLYFGLDYVTNFTVLQSIPKYPFL
jgi:hypothetical protein